MNKEDAAQLVTQLQQAHRLSVGFYRRILPTIDTLARSLDCEFWEWEPIHTYRPAGPSRQPSNYWAWDYVPLYASCHTYGRYEDDEQTSTNDVGVEFYLYIEDSFKPADGGINDQPDPITLPEGKAVLEACLYRPKDNYDQPFPNLWQEDAETPPVIGTWSSVSKHFNGIKFQWPLADVICDSQSVADTLQKNSSPM